MGKETWKGWRFDDIELMIPHIVWDLERATKDTTKGFG